MKKTYFCLILAVVIAFSAICASAAAFIDVPEDAYYAKSAERMNELGILTGYGDGRYNGEENITRAQMAVVAVRLLGKEEEAKALMGETVFTDFTPALDWATGYVNYAVAERIILGDGNGEYRPNDAVKYEEVVKIIVCVLGLDGDVEIVPEDWSKEYLEAANEAGLLGGLIGKKGEPMKRSDIAVICDTAITHLENATEETAQTEETTTVPEVTTKATTEKTENPITTTATTKKPETTEVVTTEDIEDEPEPEETAVVTTKEPEAIEPEETTEATTKAPAVTTVPVTSETSLLYDNNSLPSVGI